MPTHDQQQRKADKKIHFVPVCEITSAGDYSPIAGITDNFPDQMS